MTTIRCLVTGHVRAKAGKRGLRRYVVNDWCDDSLPVNAFLIEHEGDLWLFDTGQTARAAENDWFPGWQPFFRLSRFELSPTDEVAAQLSVRGIDLRRVQRVVLSHLHTDHVGGLDAFTHAEVIVTRKEWQHANGLHGRARGYLPQYWPAALEPRLVDFDDPSIGPFAASRDLIGDGRMLLVPTPGHTPGHAALLVRGSERSWLLAGDLAHTIEELDQVAPSIAKWCRDGDIAVLTAHDPAAAALAPLDRG